MIKSETELIEKYNIPKDVGCCLSCHDEMAMGYDDMTIKVEGVEYLACCSIIRYIEDILKLPEEKL